MKKKIQLIFLLFISITAWTQNAEYVSYTRYISKAQTAAVKGKYKKAHEYYIHAFSIKKPIATDFNNAMDVELILNKGKNKKALFTYISIFRREAYNTANDIVLDVLEMNFPEIKELSYYKEIPLYIEKIEYVKKKGQPYDKIKRSKFEAIRSSDQSIRDSVGNIKNNNVDIYNSKFSYLIDNQDGINIRELVKLMKDTLFNEYNCISCLNTISLVINHVSAKGDTTWIEPLVTLLNNGQIDSRNFMRIIDDANQKPTKTILKNKGLLFGTFNGFRLYDCIVFKKYSKQERKTINQNRKEYGYMSLKQERRIVTWQYRNKDIINFIPYHEFIYMDGFESKEQIQELLSEQHDYIQKLKEKRIKYIIKKK